MKLHIRFALVLAVTFSLNLATSIAQTYSWNAANLNKALYQSKDYNALKADFKEQASAFQKVEQELKNLALKNHKEQAAYMTNKLKQLEAKGIISKRSPLFLFADIPLTNNAEVNAASVAKLRVVMQKLKASKLTELEMAVFKALEETTSDRATSQSGKDGNNGAMLGSAIGAIVGAGIGALVPAIGIPAGLAIGKFIGGILGKVIGNMMNNRNNDGEDSGDGEQSNEGDGNPDGGASDGGDKSGDGGGSGGGNLPQ